MVPKLDLPKGMIGVDLSKVNLEWNDLYVNIIYGVLDFVIKEKSMNYLLKPCKFIVVLKLLQKRIGYLTLCDRINTMWHPIGRFRFIDQANFYYLVQFKREDDFIHSFIGGSWLLFVSYLFVHV